MHFLKKINITRCIAVARHHILELTAINADTSSAQLKISSSDLLTQRIEVPDTHLELHVLLKNNVVLV